jgi:hypothetical protein
MGMPDEALLKKAAKDEHVGESAQKRASRVQKAREDPVWDRLVAAGLYDHGRV